MVRCSEEIRALFKPYIDFEKLIEQVEKLALKPHTYSSKRMAQSS